MIVRIGSRVSFDDPWGYAGTGTVEEINTRYHDAVRVRMDSDGRSVWFLGPHVRPLQ